MTRVSKRKRRLTFITEGTSRYRGRERGIIVDVDMNGYAGTVRLAGTRQRYEFSWRWLFDHAANLHAEKQKLEKKKERMRKKGFNV